MIILMIIIIIVIILIIGVGMYILLGMTRKSSNPKTNVSIQSSNNPITNQYHNSTPGQSSNPTSYNGSWDAQFNSPIVDQYNNQININAKFSNPVFNKYANGSSDVAGEESYNPMDQITNIIANPFKTLAGCTKGVFTGTTCTESNGTVKVANAFKTLAGCTRGTFTGTTCTESEGTVKLANGTKNATQCSVGFFNGNGCKSSNNYTINKLVSKIDTYFGSPPTLSCPSGFDLDGLTCVKAPPPGYRRDNGNLVSYFLNDSISYPMGVGTIASQDNSACNGLNAIVHGIGTCTGNDINCSGCGCIKQAVNSTCGDGLRNDGFSCWNDETGCTSECAQRKWGKCVWYRDVDCKVAHIVRDADRSCPNGWRNDGTSCWEDKVCTGGIKTRDAPRSCPSNREFDDAKTLCYPKCREGYSKRPGDVISCWNDKPAIITIPAENRTTPTFSCDNDKDYVSSVSLCYPKCPSNTTRSNITQCKSNCPPNFSRDSNDNCISTDNQLQLPICLPGKISINNECIDICSATITTNCIDLGCATGSTYNTSTNRCESNAIIANATCTSTQTTINEQCYDPCPTGSFMNMKDGQCITNCKTGFTYNYTTGVCEKQTSADKCLDSQTTISGQCYNPCPSGSFMNMKDGQCITNCKTGFTYNYTTGICEKQTPADKCLDTQTTINGKCLDPCQTGYFRGKNNEECVKNCETGFTYNIVTDKCERAADKCLDSQTTISGKCYDPCQSGSFMNMKDGQCIKCNPGFTYNLLTGRCVKVK